MVTYHKLKKEEMNRELFADFIRHQVVDKCRRKIDGEWKIISDPFIDEWSEDEYQFLIKCLINTIEEGGLVEGAFEEGRLKGFVSVEKNPIGTKKNYLDLSSIHVSEDMRGKWIGKNLFAHACKWAKEKGAEKLYISAHSAIESQAFYQAMGCVEAEEYNARHVEEEPCDCQLEFVLYEDFMKISREFTEHIEEIVKITYEKYSKAWMKIDAIPKQRIEEVQTYILAQSEDKGGLVYIEDDEVKGYVLYGTWSDEAGTVNCYVPVWGYGAIGQEQDKIISYLFQSLAEQLVKDAPVHFCWNVYRADNISIQTLSRMQFGIQCEIGVRSINGNGMGRSQEQKNQKIIEIEKTQLLERWNEVWTMVHGIVEHLQKSPVFYPGEEFTEEVYQEFLMDPATRVFVAEEKDKWIGMIEANSEGREFFLQQKECYNVGEVFVRPAYRGNGIAQALLRHVDEVMQQEGRFYQWVEHGPANIEGSRFWNEHFQNYSYTMIRDIMPVTVKHKC